MAALLLALAAAASAFYLPGVAPVDYPQGANVQLKVNKLTSTKTQLPYEYYWLPFCRPKHVHHTVENLGEVLRGDRIESSPYVIEMGVPKHGETLCVLDSELTPAKISKFVQKIKQDYRVHMIVDNLPAATPQYLQEVNGDRTIKSYELGYYVGFKTESADNKGHSDIYINNHLSINLLIHDPDPLALERKYRIVGFEVHAKSIDHKIADGKIAPSTWEHLDSLPPMRLSSTTKALAFSYDVNFEEKPDIRWASRWDTYLFMLDDQIHWFSIVNSLMIVFFLAGMIAMILMRTLHQDLSRYNQLESAEDAQEETGWKLVHGDVFRPPENPMLLSVSVGSGMQVFAMMNVTMVFAVLGFLSPANRGSLLTSMVLVYVLMGMVAGYASARNYKMLKGAGWKRNTILTATLYPGIVFGIFFILNFFLWGEQSSGAVPFGTLVALLAMWFLISVPLVFAGAYFGFKQPAVEHPVRTNQIPRQIPETVWYMREVPSILMGGILPFGAVFIELFFILSSIWLHQFYYIFGFLFLVIVILTVTCAEISIVLCYFQLCAEDYHWWWRSFWTSGSSALYVLLYSIFYFKTKLEIHSFVSTVLFFGYTAIICLVFCVLTGSIGYYSCLIFVRKIYASVKVD